MITDSNALWVGLTDSNNDVLFASEISGYDEM